jgi:protein-arginine kinase activator protein McsA
MKICKMCNTEKLEIEFYKRSDSSDGLQYRCKDCMTNYLDNRDYKPIFDNQEMVCSTCNISKSKTEFYSDRRQKSGLRPQCKDCNKNTAIKRKFGITSVEYEKLLKHQQNKCAICQRDNVLFHIDHDHVTGKIRGLLCSNCNTAIGLLKEDEGILLMVIKYLKENNDKTTLPRASSITQSF